MSHQRQVVIAFADGRVELVEAEDIPNLRWTVDDSSVESRFYREHDGGLCGIDRKVSPSRRFRLGLLFRWRLSR
ncbi:MAG: hypothetical protein ACYSUT_11570 [Planctomycetota bacterium]